MPMSPEDRLRLENVCYKSKRGIATHGDLRFAQKMWRLYSDEYQLIQQKGAMRAMSEVNPLATTNQAGGK